MDSSVLRSDCRIESSFITKRAAVHVWLLSALGIAVRASQAAVNRERAEDR